LQKAGLPNPWEGADHESVRKSRGPIELQAATIPSCVPGLSSPSSFGNFSSLDDALIEVWRQALVENAKTVELDGQRFPVRWNPKRGLRQVDVVSIPFVFAGF